jgi:ketosteroid isomerase-like protein
MTVDELLAHAAIRHTLSSCNIAGDANDAEAYAAVYADDGVLEFGEMRVAGRDGIRDWKAARAKGPPPAQFVRHNLTTSRVELTGADTAKARSYFVVFTEVGPDHCGTYTDQLRKAGEGWVIAHRQVRLDWQSQASRFRATR